MITNIHSRSDWLYTNASPSSIYVGNQQSAGMLRYNTQSNHLEVYDGNNWLAFGANATIELTPEAERILRWAQEKMIREHELELLMKNHPGLRDLHEKFEMMKQLCLEEEKVKKS